MAIFSKMNPNWYCQQGDVKICVLGLTMTTDSPRLLLLTLTCGVVTIGVVSGAFRAFLYNLWNKARRGLAIVLNPALEYYPEKPQIIHRMSLTEMGQNVSSTVVLDTTSREPEPELLATYAIIDLPRIRVPTKDAATSPTRPTTRNISVATSLACFNDRGCSPFPLMESGTPEELLMFETETFQDGSSGPFENDNSELYEKLASIQKALQEANQEMDHTMSSLSELSQRHFCSTSAATSQSTSRIFLPPHQTSSADLAANAMNGLVWEDEFDTGSSNPRNAVSDDLMLWQSDLNFYSGLCGDSTVETARFDPTSAFSTLSGMTTSSGSSDLWETDVSGEPVNSRVCVLCAGALPEVENLNVKDRHPMRPCSAPSSSSFSLANSGAVCTNPGSSCASCLSSCSPLSLSPDRVPKLKAKK